MKYIVGKDRQQSYIFPVSLEEAITEDNEVRLIDMFVTSLDLKVFGFRVHFPENGRPAYHPKDLLKLFIYGYMNKIRSSRDLEKETKRNLEVMWLLNSLSPDHNTISNFRRDNPKAIKKVFRATVEIAKNFDLIGGKIIAGDSTKFRAQNSKKNNFNQKKIDRHVAYIDQKLEEYSKLLVIADDNRKEEIKKDIDKHKNRKDSYKKLDNQLKETGEKQISTSDPESRQMIIRNNITEVAYNVQTTVDSKHNLPFDYKVTNHNDSKAMGNMLQRAKSILRNNSFTALYDKGYHTGSEFALADTMGIKTLVAIPAIPRSSNAPDKRYNVEHFDYDEKGDYYTCPEGYQLKSNGVWYRTWNNAYRFRQFKTNMCNVCTAREKCTTSKHNGKTIQRSEYTKYLVANKIRVEKNNELYRKRQQIVEHPFGTIKRQWGFDHVLTKMGMQRAGADIGFIMIAYNLKRIFNIVGKKQFSKHLKMFISSCLSLIIKSRQLISFSKPVQIMIGLFHNYFQVLLVNHKLSLNLASM